MRVRRRARLRLFAIACRPSSSGSLSPDLVDLGWPLLLCPSPKQRLSDDQHPVRAFACPGHSVDSSVVLAGLTGWVVFAAFDVSAPSLAVTDPGDIRLRRDRGMGEVHVLIMLERGRGHRDLYVAVYGDIG